MFFGLTPLELGAWISVILTFLIVGMVVGQMLMKGGSSTNRPSVKSRVERLSKLAEELKNELPAHAESSNKSKSLFSKVDLKPLLEKYTGEVYFNRLERDLAQADIPLRVSEFLIMRGVIIVIAAMCGLILTKNIIVGLLVGLAFVFAHVPVIIIRKKGRVNKFNNQLAEFLILIVNSLRAGQTFMQGADVAARESPEPISSEFKQVLKEINLGMPVEVSMDNLLERVPSEDLKIVVAAYTIQRKVGGNLATIFETTAATIRERIRIQGQIDTLTTQGKLSGVVVGIIPFVIAIIMNGMMPAMMNYFYSSLAGKIMIGIALVLQTIGALAIKKIVSIEI
jgi:tight adherence protein B